MSGWWPAISRTAARASAAVAGRYHLIARHVQRRRAIGDADAPAGREDGGTGLRLVAITVNQIAIQPEREHGGDAVARVLVELRRHILGRVVLRAGARALGDAQMSVTVDQSGDDEFMRQSMVPAPRTSGRLIPAIRAPSICRDASFRTRPVPSMMVACWKMMGGDCCAKEGRG